MCLITEQKEPIITTEDIVVYKLFKKNVKGYSSYYQAYHYTPGEVHETEFKFTEFNQGALDKRARIHICGTDSCDLDALIGSGKVLSIADGFHFATNKSRLEDVNRKWSKLCKCIIPAGSTVYYDGDELGVSNKIILPKK